MDELEETLSSIVVDGALAEVQDAAAEARDAQERLDAAVRRRDELAVEALQAGATYRQVADAAGVSRSTVQGWEGAHLRRTLREGRR